MNNKCKDGTCCFERSKLQDEGDSGSKKFPEPFQTRPVTKEPQVAVNVGESFATVKTPPRGDDRAGNSPVAAETVSTMSSTRPGFHSESARSEVTSMKPTPSSTTGLPTKIGFALIGLASNVGSAIRNAPDAASRFEKWLADLPLEGKGVHQNDVHHANKQQLMEKMASEAPSAAQGTPSSALKTPHLDLSNIHSEQNGPEDPAVNHK